MRVLVPLLLLVAQSVSAQAVQVDRIIATVDSRAITRSEVDVRADKSKLSRAEAVNALIDEYLMAKDAVHRGISVSDAEVDRAIEMVIESNKISREEFNGALKAQNYTMEQYRTAIGLQILELRWLTIRTSSLEKPTEEPARGEWLAEHKKKLITELRAKAAVEVRP